MVATLDGELVHPEFYLVCPKRVSKGEKYLPIKECVKVEISTGPLSQANLNSFGQVQNKCTFLVYFLKSLAQMASTIKSKFLSLISSHQLLK